LRELGTVASFKIIQESVSRTRVLVVPSAGFDGQTEVQIRSAFKRRLGNDVEIHIETVTDIPPEKSGKYRYVQSLVPRKVPVHA
jgi:phenylacetate-CoA ligase